MKTIDEILNRQKYGLPKSPEPETQPVPDTNEWIQNEQQHKETQEWFHQKLAETEEEYRPMSPNDQSSASTIWSPSQTAEQPRFAEPESSSSGHASPHERKEKEFLEETVR